MKRAAFLVMVSLQFLCSHAQRIQTIVPKQVVIGNAFQIQYIITDPASLLDVTVPTFNNLQLISGPNYYKGNSLVNGKSQAIENITFTVVPLTTGVTKIDPLVVKFKNGDERTDEVVIKVVPQPKASFNSLSTYTDIKLYAPSSKTDLDKLIEENLFIRTEVDKTNCFLGEAITATFKLYSRLQSTSEVVNAPSLYGFSVMDLLNINEAHQAVETIGGKVFNTSVLRKLQLYPAQTGTLTIDEMQLQNVIEFDDSLTGKKIKVEKFLASKPVDIKVKPLPTPAPQGFNEAVGKFLVNAGLQNTKIAANTQGKLVVTVSGEGNFIQLNPPTVSWPKSFDVFDPLVTDELNKNKTPTEGRRKYVFNFTVNDVGKFILPPIVFTFFDPTSAKYKTIATDSIMVEVVAPAKTEDTPKRVGITNKLSKSWIYILIAVILAAIPLFFLRKKKSGKQMDPPAPERTNYLQKLEDLTSKQVPTKQFCIELQRLLTAAGKEYHLNETQKKELQLLEKDCQLVTYSAIESASKSDELRRRAEAFFKTLTS